MTRRPMTDLEIARAKALGGGLVRMVPGTSAKRFAIQMHRSAAGDQQITDKQAAYLEMLAWTFRRQLSAHLVPAQKPEPQSTVGGE